MHTHLLATHMFHEQVLHLLLLVVCRLGPRNSDIQVWPRLQTKHVRRVQLCTAEFTCYMIFFILSMHACSDAAHSLLRPETVESLFVMHRLTGDDMYREWG